MTSDLISSVAGWLLLALVAVVTPVLLWRDTRRLPAAPDRNHTAEMVRMAKWSALVGYAATRHGHTGNGVCGCGRPVPCPERTALDDYASDLAKEIGAR